MQLCILFSFITLMYLFQASYEPAVSPVRSPVRIPSPETVTPPLSASDVERNIKDAVSTSHYGGNSCCNM